MPIEIRPSDVMFKAADVLRGASRAAGGISRDLYEADRVSQVNRQLAYLEQIYQDYNENLPQQMFDARGEEMLGHPLDTGVLSVVKKSFGQASLSDIEADEDKFFQSQLEYITKNTTNKAARQEMIQHLTMKNIQNKGIIANKWNVAADREAMASLNTLYSTVLSSNEPWEEKVRRISDRVDQMVSVGRLWKDEGENIKAKATAAAQYSFAHNGAMTMMKETGDPEAGETWLKQNTPFYDGNPDAREKVLDDVRQEFDYFAKTEDEALDVGFADLHIRADTIEKVDAALSGLRDTHFYDGDKKYTWETRFLQRKEYLKNLGKLPKGVLDDWYKQNEDLLLAQLVFAKDKDVPLGQLKKMVEDSYFFVGPDGIQAPRIRGSFVKTAYEYLDVKEDPAFTAGLKYIQSKTGGLNDLDKARVTNEFLAWYKTNTGASQKEIEIAANNFVDPAVQRDLDKQGRRTWQVLFGDKRVLDEYELLTRDIEEGKYTGIGPSRAEYLARYNAYVVARAQDEYPQYNIASAFTDFSGEYGGGPGTAILVDGSGVPFSYKLEDKQLSLYRLGRTRAGTYEWQEVAKPGTATGAEQAQEIIREQEKQAEQKELAAGREAGRELERKVVPELRGAGKAPEIVLEDWIHTAAGWYNKKTLSFATNPDVIKKLNQLKAGR